MGEAVRSTVLCYIAEKHPIEVRTNCYLAFFALVSVKIGFLTYGFKWTWGSAESP